MNCCCCPCVSTKADSKYKGLFAIKVDNDAIKYATGDSFLEAYASFRETIEDKTIREVNIKYIGDVLI